MIWLYKTKIWRKSKTLLNGHRQRHCPHKTEDSYKDIAEDIETRFDTSNYEIDRLLPMGKNKKVIGLIKDELGGQIMKKLVGLRPKTCSYLKDNNDEGKKAIGTKKCVVKRKLKFEESKNYLKISRIINVVNY